MSFDAPIEPAQVMLFARSVGDTDSLFSEQLFSAQGSILTTPPTFVQALNHFDPGSMTRPALPRQDENRGGRTDTVHAEQHFEYLAPFRTGDRVSVEISRGDTWTKEGRSGRLRFTETLTQYLNQDGDVLVRSRKVSVRVGDNDD